LEVAQLAAVGELLQGRAAKNAELLAEVKADRHASELYETTVNDAMNGRMTWPQDAAGVCLDTVTLSPRFGVEQGLKADGSSKIRPIDDLTRSGCNAATSPSEKLQYESLDTLLAVGRAAGEAFGHDLSLWKADIASAYRRIPVAPEHRQFGHVVFSMAGQTMVSQHLVLPFGAVASVHHWNRVGDMIKTLARRLLHLPVCRFVDDYFAVERLELAAHALEVFVRLVRALMGTSAIENRKCDHGNPMAILGVSVCVTQFGFTFVPDEAKVTKWSRQIAEALRTSRLTGGEASKLSGRLSWASQHIFRRVGRALLYPIYKQKRARHSTINDELRLALTWWLTALQCRKCELRVWRPVATRTCQLLCDARSTPPRVAAFLVIDGCRFYSDAAPPVELMEFLKPRNDGQITSLEILSIAFGLSTFLAMLRGRNVHVFSDNTSAEHNTSKGRAKSFDHTMIIHSIWSVALEESLGLYVSRVASKDNIADDPSRERYGLVARMGAKRMPPQLLRRFHEPAAWESVRLRK
jgi:hypothetical protein